LAFVEKYGREFQIQKKNRASVGILDHQPVAVSGTNTICFIKLPEEGVETSHHAIDFLHPTKPETLSAIHPWKDGNKHLYI